MIIILHAVLYKIKCKLYYFSGIYLLIVGIFSYITQDIHQNLKKCLFFFFVLLLYLLIVTCYSTKQSIQAIIGICISNKRYLSGLDILGILIEELIYRQAAMLILSFFFPKVATVLIMTLLFWIVHEFSTMFQKVEFLLFSLLLCYVFYITNSLVLMLIVHIIRNYIIVNCERIQ